MPRKIYLAKHLSSEQLREKYLKSTEAVESRRWHLIWKVSLGWSLKNSAVAVGISYEYARAIIRKYNQIGEMGVINRKYNLKTGKRGKLALLNQEQLAKLSQDLQSRPSDAGVWTGPKVARWIERETGREKVWNQRGWDYLKKLNYSRQSPRRKHQKGSEEEQQKFKENLAIKREQIQQKTGKAKLELWFFDEHRIGLKPILRKVWSRRGERPIALVNHRYEWLYVYGFVQPETGESLWYLIPRVSIAWLNLVYQQFAKDAGISAENPILLVEDNAGWHRSQKSVIPQGIELEFLPPYSPELQPAERLWPLVDEAIANQCINNLEELEDLLVTRCNILRDKKEEIKNLTNYSWLNLS